MIQARIVRAFGRDKDILFAMCDTEPFTPDRLARLVCCANSYPERTAIITSRLQVMENAGFVRQVEGGWVRTPLACGVLARAA